MDANFKTPAISVSAFGRWLIFWTLGSSRVFLCFFAHDQIFEFFFDVLYFA